MTFLLEAEGGDGESGPIMARVLKSWVLHSARALRIELPIWPLAPNRAMFLSDMILSDNDVGYRNVRE